MATTSTSNLIVGIKTASVWGTAISVAGGYSLRCNSMTLSGGFGTYQAQDIGLSAMLTGVTQINGQFSVSITTDVAYGQAWQHCLAMVNGTELTQVEVTGGQADYRHSTHTNGSTKGKFSTLAWLVEDDRALEIPSVKWTNFTMTGQAGTVGKVTATGIADQIRVASVNSVAILNALSALAYESAVFAGANAYCRIANRSTSTALSATDDKQITDFQLSISRPHTERHPLRGANTKFTVEPTQSGLVDTKLTVTMSETDDSLADFLSDWTSQTAKMAEISIQGTQIGTGLNKTVMIRMPYAVPTGTLPGGYDIPGINAIATPTLELQLCSAASNAAQMWNSYPVITSTIDGNNAKWT